MTYDKEVALERKCYLYREIGKLDWKGRKEHIRKTCRADTPDGTEP